MKPLRRRFWAWRWRASLRWHEARRWLGRVRNCHRNAARLAAIEQALNARDLFINPHLMEAMAARIDCEDGCDHVWHEPDTNAGGCHRSERGEYCPNDLAETLRELARVARAG
jgi:hypothetical protein